MINGHQEIIDQISIKYLTDFGRTLKDITGIYLNISQISVDSGHRVKKKLEKLLKTVMIRPNTTAGCQGYQGLLNTGYHELLPLAFTSRVGCRYFLLIFSKVTQIPP